MIGLPAGIGLMDWVTMLLTEALWRNALAAVPLAVAVALICRFVPCRPATRHTMWFVALLMFLVPPLLSGLPRPDLGALVTTATEWMHSAVDADSADGADPQTERLSSTVSPTTDSDAGHLSAGAARGDDARGGIVRNDAAWNKRQVPFSEKSPRFLPPLPRGGREEFSRWERTSPSPSLSRRRAGSATAFVGMAPLEMGLVGTALDANSALTDGLRSVLDSFNDSIVARPDLDKPTATPIAEPAMPASIVDNDFNADWDSARIVAVASPETRGAAQAEGVLPNGFRSLIRRSLAFGHRWISGLGEVREAVLSMPPLSRDVWIGGSVLFALVGGFRILRFRRLVRRATPAPPDVQTLVGNVGRRIGLRRIPTSLMTEARLSPLIWCGRRPRLILPCDLWAQLDDAGRTAVVSHELAHIRRRDHWVCWIQSLVGCLLWWNPIVWWVRHRIEDEADLCCDAWVTHLMPRGRRAYAEALLKTKEFMSFRPVAVPSVGIGVATGRARPFARRLTMVMTKSVRPRLSASGMTMVLMLCAAGWLATPAQSCPNEEKKSTPCRASTPPTAPAALPAVPAVPGSAALVAAPAVPGVPSPPAAAPAPDGAPQAPLPPLAPRPSGNAPTVAPKNGEPISTFESYVLGNRGRRHGPHFDDGSVGTDGPGCCCKSGGRGHSGGHGKSIGHGHSGGHGHFAGHGRSDGHGASFKCKECAKRGRRGKGFKGRHHGGCSHAFGESGNKGAWGSNRRSGCCGGCDKECGDEGCCGGGFRAGPAPDVFFGPRGGHGPKWIQLERNLDRLQREIDGLRERWHGEVGPERLHIRKRVRRDNERVHRSHDPRREYEEEVVIHLDEQRGKHLRHQRHEFKKARKAERKAAKAARKAERAARREARRSRSDEGGGDKVITRVYRLPEGKLKELTELMVRSDVPVLVRSLDDGIEVRATRRQHRAFAGFVRLIHPDRGHGHDGDGDDDDGDDDGDDDDDRASLRGMLSDLPVRELLEHAEGDVVVSVERAVEEAKELAEESGAIAEQVAQNFPVYLSVLTKNLGSADLEGVDVEVIGDAVKDAVEQVHAIEMPEFKEQTRRAIEEAVREIETQAREFEAQFREFEVQANEMERQAEEMERRAEEIESRSSGSHHQVEPVKTGADESKRRSQTEMLAKAEALMDQARVLETKVKMLEEQAKSLRTKAGQFQQTGEELRLAASLLQNETAAVAGQK